MEAKHFCDCSMLRNLQLLAFENVELNIQIKRSLKPLFVMFPVLGSSQCIVKLKLYKLADMFSFSGVKQFYLLMKTRFFRVPGNVPKKKPKASEVLTAYLKQTHEPPWTSYFVKSKDVIDDHYGRSYFNWPVNDSNYAVIRARCYPYIKYYCTKAPKRDLTQEDKFYSIIIALNNAVFIGMLYGITAFIFVRHKEVVHLETGDVYIHFLLKEDKGSKY